MKLRYQTFLFVLPLMMSLNNCISLKNASSKPVAYIPTNNVDTLEVSPDSQPTHANSLPSAEIPNPKMKEPDDDTPAQETRVKPNTPTTSISTSPSSSKKVMIIGDSLSSSAGRFGSELAKHLSQNNRTACLHSVSGSRFDHWNKEAFQSSMYGATYRNYTNGSSTDSKDIPKSKQLPSNWSLSNLLSQNPCGSSGSVDELIVQLGSNHSPNDDPIPYIQKVLSTANTNGVKEVKFILPPRGRSSQNKFRNFNDKAISYLSGKNGVTYFDSSTDAIQASSDFRDEDHFWRSNSESNWLEKVKRWAYQNPTTTSGSDPLLAHK